MNKLAFVVTFYYIWISKHFGGVHLVFNYVKQMMVTLEEKYKFYCRIRSIVHRLDHQVKSLLISLTTERRIRRNKTDWKNSTYPVWQQWNSQAKMERINFKFIEIGRIQLQNNPLTLQAGCRSQRSCLKPIVKPMVHKILAL